jgi:hypothetical protein
MVWLPDWLPNYRPNFLSALRVWAPSALSTSRRTSLLASDSGPSRAALAVLDARASRSRVSVKPWLGIQSTWLMDRLAARINRTTTDRTIPAKMSKPTVVLGSAMLSVCHVRIGQDRPEALSANGCSVSTGSSPRGANRVLHPHPAVRCSPRNCSETASADLIRPAGRAARGHPLAQSIAGRDRSKGTQEARARCP